VSEDRTERAGEGCRVEDLLCLKGSGISGEVAREEEGEGDRDVGDKGELGKILERKRAHFSGSLDLNLNICASC
jgi:hypothetical protein